MGKSSREKRIREVVARCVAEQFDGVGAEDVKDSTRFVEDLGCDILDIVEFDMLIEQVFLVSVPSDIETNVRTVGDIVGFLLARDAVKPIDIDLQYFK